MICNFILDHRGIICRQRCKTWMRLSTESRWSSKICEQNASYKCTQITFRNLDWNSRNCVWPWQGSKLEKSFKAVQFNLCARNGGKKNFQNSKITHLEKDVWTILSCIDITCTTTVPCYGHVVDKCWERRAIISFPEESEHINIKSSCRECVDQCFYPHPGNVFLTQMSPMHTIKK